MSDDRIIEITGSRIISVKIAGRDMRLEGDPNSTTRTLTLPDDLSDGPWSIVVTLPDNNQKTVEYKYREKEEGNNQITIATRVSGEKTLVKAMDDVADAIRNLRVASARQPASSSRR
jgi:hypothetical protein